MKPDISEFSGAYAVTEALVRRWRRQLDTAPVFPSLIDEGGLGCDVSLVLPASLTTPAGWYG